LLCYTFWGDRLKKWEANGVEGFFLLVIGIIVIIWGFQAVEPIQIEHTWGLSGCYIKASLDPTFVVLFMVGCLLLGFGLGVLGCVGTIYKLEKKLSPPPPPSS